MSCHSSSIGRWVSVLYRYSQCYFDKKLEPFNLGSGQFIFLVVLFEKDKVSQEFLTNLLDIDKATTARAIRKLEENGYVKRSIDPKDKRARIVSITEKAFALKPQLKQISEQWTDILTKGFNREERELVLKLLEQMAENAASTVTEV